MQSARLVAMAIDGVGKPAGTGLGGVQGVGGPSPQTSDFQVGRTDASSPAAGSDALGRLERGEISLDQYLDGLVSSGTAHLEGRLPAAELDFVRETLREQVKTDPVLVELVRRATGASPVR